MTDPSMARFAAIVGRPDDEIDLASAALEIAADAYPGLQSEPYLARLDALAEEVRRRLPSAAEPLAGTAAVARHLFVEAGFAGNRAAYHDPRNSYLNEVLDRRLGIPITLSVLLLEVGWRLRLPLAGVSFPGHFLVRCRHADGQVVLDPFHGGRTLTRENLLRLLTPFVGDEAEAHRQLPRALEPASKREILMRMLRNLRAVHLEGGYPERALAVVERMLILAPDRPEALRERASLYQRLDCFRAARDDYRRYLDLAPGAADATEVRARLGELEAAVARLH